MFFHIISGKNPLLKTLENIYLCSDLKKDYSEGNILFLMWIQHFELYNSSKMLMLNANYNDSFFDRLMYVSDYSPWKKLERKTSSNPETEKPCCLLAVYSFPAEKEWQAILKGQKVVRKKQKLWHCPFHWLKGHRLMPILPGSKLLPEVTRLQPSVCCY